MIREYFLRQYSRYSFSVIPYKKKEPLNSDQFDRYKKLIKFIDENFKDDINIQKIEEVCHYSYRNINRIFQALHQEPIGRYIKRIRLEKAAQFLKYSDEPITNIAMEVGFEDHAAFTKAFRNKYDCAPSAFRNSSNSIQSIIRDSILQAQEARQKLKYEIEYLPAFDFLCLEYRGNYEDNAAIEARWHDLLAYAEQKKLVNAKTPFFAEIIDDNEITDIVHCRYNMSVVLDRPLGYQPEGLFHVRSHARQKYAKFIHKGDRNALSDAYQNIYAFWMIDVPLEFEDLATLEFYINDEKATLTEKLLTEIYIPVK